MSYVPLLDQLHSYAKDLNRAVESAREKDLELESTKAQMFKFAEDLNETYQELKQAHLEMEQGYLDTIHRLSLAAEYKDEDTGDHIVRMSRYCSKFAEVLDFTERQVRNMRYASPMHDIGKIGIPDHILLKKGRLTKEEFNVIKSHTIIGPKYCPAPGLKFCRSPNRSRCPIMSDGTVEGIHWGWLERPFQLKPVSLPLQTPSTP
ncbi:Response regulator c-di-GMP phosphodiesterase, RpfG family [Olavius algarvensis associated proteobacterium Delta 3]|nr:Response regulator c-di-GMP phosphodiesterase, RpfG family [Olavius algarvensis associated proteobacterium Delta 3]